MQKKEETKKVNSIYESIEMFKEFRLSENFETISDMVCENTLFYKNNLSIPLNGMDAIKNHFNKIKGDRKINYFNINDVNITKFETVCTVSYYYDYEAEIEEEEYDNCFCHKGKEILIFESREGTWKLVSAVINNGGYTSYKK